MIWTKQNYLTTDKEKYTANNELNAGKLIIKWSRYLVLQTFTNLTSKTSWITLYNQHTSINKNLDHKQIFSNCLLPKYLTSHLWRKRNPNPLLSDFYYPELSFTGTLKKTKYMYTVYKYIYTLKRSFVWRWLGNTMSCFA